MTSPQISQQNGLGGYFRIYASTYGQARKDITTFRGKPTKITSMSTTDPFGYASAALSFATISGFDRPGQGDLDWLVPWANVDIVYHDAGGVQTGWVWEGMIVNESINSDGYSLALKGALYQADNLMAAPWFPQYPVPYELLIKSALDPSRSASLRTSPLNIQFPSDWTLKVPAFNEPSYLWFLRPWGVSPGSKWTGLTTRNTGGWEPVLTGFVQTLLSVMYTEDGGQWTIRMSAGRVPTLMVRPALRFPTAETLVVHYGAPGVEVAISRDFSQSTNVVYGSGTDLSGSAYSGQQVTRDGQTTYYEPFASLPQVYPDKSGNPRYLSSIVRKESRLQFPNGMDEVSARDTAATHLRRFADPGYIGTVELTSDPLLGDEPYPRQLVVAGQSILVKGIRGGELLFHITETNANPEQGTISLSVDTKFRDALTVAEVRARTRDALDPVRMLRVGQFSSTVQDSIKPWSYAQGSGVIPSGGGLDATELFTKLAAPTERFPWTALTKKYPPKKYPNYYIKIGPKSVVADKNWAGITRSGIAMAAIPIKMAQAGTIRLTQFAAYDINGNVLPVRFHLSLYGNSGVSVRDMPMIPASAVGAGGYPQSQRYPFYQGAFEKINADGTEVNNPGQMLPTGADLLAGWGNYYEGAGYYPGRSSTGGVKTGLLVDETPWPFDTSNVPGFDKFSTKNTAKNPTAGMIYAMVYCDDQLTQPVYFLGRMFVQTVSG